MKRLRIVVLTGVACGLFSIGFVAQARAHHHHHGRHEQVTVRQVVFLTPGDGFDYGSTFESQVGEDHYQYWKKLRDQGKIEMSGYFMGSKGEMIVGAPGVSASEMERLAKGDPAVKNLVATPEVRRWLVTLAPKHHKASDDDELDGLGQ